MIKALSGVLAAGALVLAGSPAAAMTFYFDGYGGLVEGTQDVDPFPAPVFSGDRDPRDAHNVPTGDGNDAWSEFTWGTGSPPDSHVVVSGIEDTAYVVGGDFIRFGKSEHFNEPINEWWEPGDTSSGMADRPAQIEISWNLDIYATAADAAASTNSILEKEYTFILNFRETRNVADIADCIASVDGFPRPTHVTNCDDIFYVSEASQDGEDPVPSVGGVFELTDTFEYDGQEYTLTMNGFYEADNPIDPDNSTFSLKGPHWSCEGGFPGSNAPCTTDWRFQIVPEPSLAMLAAVSLAALAISRRRRAAH